MAKVVAGMSELMEQAGDRAVRVLEKDGINFTESGAAVVSTIAGNVVEQTIKTGAEKFLSGSGEPVEIDFMSLFTIVISNRDSSDGEKDGNINIAFIPGPQAKLAVKSDGDTETEED